MSIDNTHTKYLKGKDKSAWSGFKSALESSKNLASFTDAFSMPLLKEGEEIEIPVRKPSKDKANKKDSNTTK